MNQRLKYKLFPNCYETTVFDVICTAEPCKALCLASLKQSHLLVGDKNSPCKCSATCWDRLSCLVQVLTTEDQRQEENSSIQRQSIFSLWRRTVNSSYVTYVSLRLLHMLSLYYVSWTVIKELISSVLSDHAQK